MSPNQADPRPPAEEALQLLETAVRAGTVEQLADRVLPLVARMTHAQGAFLYLPDGRLLEPRFYCRGLLPGAVDSVREVCDGQFRHFSDRSDLQQVAVFACTSREPEAELALYALCDETSCIGLVGLAPQEGVTLRLFELWPRLLAVLGAGIGRLAEQARWERQVAHLNTYLTVSSMLIQPLGLHELLEIALYCSMETVSAEAASVLLLDDEKKAFQFYQVEGPAKPVLTAATFPADKGLAGSVLQSQQAEIVNDVQRDPRFYEHIDSTSGFQTRNMIAVPLFAGEEPVGVLEVLNKAGGGSFTDEERLLLLSIAEEIAFAVRNAKVFEYVVSSYCKQRQGLATCKGCKRPLGSWTPCAKYREVSV